MSDDKQASEAECYAIRVQAPDGAWHLVRNREEWLALKARYDAQPSETTPKRTMRLQD